MAEEHSCPDCAWRRTRITELEDEVSRMIRRARISEAEVERLKTERDQLRKTILQLGEELEEVRGDLISELGKKEEVILAAIALCDVRGRLGSEHVDAIAALRAALKKAGK